MSLFEFTQTIRKKNIDFEPIYFCPSIHPSLFYTCLTQFGVAGCVWLYLLSLGERQDSPWTGHQFITGPRRDEQNKQPCTLTLTPGVRENPHMHGENKQTPHSKCPSQDLIQRPSRCEDMVRTTTPVCSPLSQSS